MGLSIKGYVLEPPRVASANSAFTSTPNDYVSDWTAWNAAYPTGSEPNPRVDYLILTLSDGLLVDALFGWTKNEAVQRFEYSGQDQRYATLAGAPLEVVGTLGTDANTNRLKVYAPLENLSTAPFRVSVGPFPGDTFTATAVTVFGSPAPHHVEILIDSLTADDNGKLNWNASDIASGSPYIGQPVSFQRQQFYTTKESTGNIGILSVDGISQEDLILNPLPGTGQFPRLRIGYGVWLTPVEVTTFTPGGPPTGSVEWMRDTGELRFSTTEITANQGKPIYYQGVLFGYNQQLPRYIIGVMPSGATPLIAPNLPASGGDIIFRLPTESVQFPLTTRIDSGATLDPNGAAGTVIVRPQVLPSLDGDVMFSAVDRSLYAGKDVEVVYGDLPIERGISLRLFRCSANLAGTDPTIKDVTCFYSVGNAVLADPVIGAPQVFLPAVPYDDGSLAVRMEQGTGSFVGDLQRLDVLPLPTAPLTYGYTIDFDNRQLLYSQYKSAPGSGTQDLSILVTSGALQLPDTLLNATGLILQLNEGTGWYYLTLGQDALIDRQAGLVSFTRTNGPELTSGATGALTGHDFVDAGGDFSQVALNDLLVLLTGGAKGVYTVTEVISGTSLKVDPAVPTPATNVGYEIHCGQSRTLPGPRPIYSQEVLADRFWVESLPIDPNTKVERIQSLGAAQNTPPLTIPSPFRNGINVTFAPSVVVTTVPDDSKFTTQPTDSVQVSLTTGNLNLTRADVVAPRFRFGSGTFSSTVRMVSDFSGVGPNQGEVHIKLSTGELLFNAADLGTTVFWVRLLRRKIDFKLTPELGLFDFTDRFLQREEALITYRPLTDSGPGSPVNERGTFLVRKEVCQDHPEPTNTLHFNPNAHQVATNPTASVFRGGRPQDDTQVIIDPVASTVRFLPDRGYMTNALPHGSIVAPIERVYVDYYIYDAIGGEKTITVLQPPMATARVLISEESPSFTIAGDQTSVYPEGYLLRVEQDEVYVIGTTVYDASQDLTTVTLAYGQKFANAQIDPKLYVPSNITPTSYFLTETATFDTIPRGMNKVYFPGDLSANYKTGMVLLMTDGASSFVDTYLITGAAYKPDTAKTEVTISMNTLRQYTAGTHLLKRSVRPILEQGTTIVQTKLNPILTQPYLVYRRIDGQPGRILASPTDYTVDDSGRIVLTSALLITEEVAICYTGHRLVYGGSTLRASYGSSIVPTEQNGLLNQILKADYTLFAPDAFYFRVETMTNFQAEVIQQFQKDAQGSTPSSGPTTSNASQPKLWEQGRESNYFQEGHLANTDIIIRAMLKYYNDAINHLEDVLQNIDGRIVGDADGRFKFDGLLNTTPRSDWAHVTNQIDDIVKVSDFPIIFNPFPVVQFLGTYQQVYLPGRWSRFYPMYRASLSAFTTGGSGTANTGDEIGDFKWTGLTSTDPAAFRRWPRAMVLKDAKAGDTTLYVDNANGSDTPVLRPPFAAGMQVIISNIVGGVPNPIVPDTTPLTVGSVGSGPETIVVSALPVDVPSGSTVYLCTTGPTPDTTYVKNYRVGFDVALNYDGGKLIFVKSYPPFDGSVPLIPPQLNIQEVGANEYIQLTNVVCNSSDTKPYRFPALDGSVLSDCGDQSIPMWTSPDQELYKLPHSTDAVSAVLADTTAETLLMGTLDGACTTITSAIAFPSPVPQPYDLVRFLVGPNLTAGFRRILSVDLGAHTITVDHPFPVVDGSLRQFLMTATNNVATDTFTMFSSTVMQLPGAIPAAIHVGHTIIITNGDRIGTRRQVSSLDTVLNRITLDHAIVIPTTSTTFRVSNHVSTYSNVGNLSGPSTDLFSIIRDNDHNINPLVVDSEIKAIDRLFDGDPIAGTNGVFTDLLPGGSSTGTCTTDTITDLTVDFSTLFGSTAATTCFVFVRNDPNQGIYPITSVVDAHHLQVSGPFPTPGSITYRVVTLFGLGKPSVQDLMRVVSAAESFLSDLTDFDALLTTQIPVTLPPGYIDIRTYATGLLSTDLTNWSTIITNRETFLSGCALSLITGVLATKDKLYDQRFTWIDGRINRKTGVTAKQLASITNRLNNLVDQQNNLTKLVTMQALQSPSPPSPAEKGYTPTC